MINAYFEKVKSWYEANQKDLYTAGVIFLVGMAGFGLGRLSILWPEKEPITIKNDELQITKPLNHKEEINSLSVIRNSSLATKGRYIASKSGVSYHYPWCPGALKIKEENKIWFQTKEEAEKRGYKPAGNCDGL